MVIFKHIAVLLSLFISYLAMAQKPYVELIVEPAQVEVGDQFTVIVKSNISGEININFPKEFEQGYNVLNRMEQDFDGNTGETITYFFHGRSGSLNKTGTYTFGPAYVKAGNRVYKSNKTTVKAISEPADQHVNIDDHLLRKPAFGKINVSKAKVYVGEAFVVNSEIISRFKPTHYDSYHSYGFEPSVDQHEIDKNNQPVVEPKACRNQIRYFFEHDKQVVFANNPGKFYINPFKITLQAGFEGYEVRSRRNHIIVMPLPAGAPKTFSGAVGKFDIQCEADKEHVKQGEMLTLTYVISGHGNLHDMGKPKVDFGSSFKIYGDPEVKEKFVFTSKGAEGSLSIVYHLQAIKEGDVKIAPFIMSYFDPYEEKYVSVHTKSSSIHIDKNPDFVLVNVDKPSEKESTIEHYNKQPTESESFFSTTAGKWIGISTPICLAFIFFLWKRRKEEDEESPVVVSKAVNEAAPTMISSAEFLSILQAHARSGNELPFFTQLSKDLQIATSQAAKGDANWVLSTDEKKAFFQEKNLSAEFQKTYFDLQQTCELCRYGCQKAEDDLSIYLTKAEYIFHTLETIS